jgi:hypothetical protein
MQLLICGSLRERLLQADGTGYSNLFFPCIEKLAEIADIPSSLLLAYTAAHEIGHLLLGADAHATTGIMKKKWDKQDFRAMLQGALCFCPEQKRALFLLTQMDGKGADEKSLILRPGYP